MINLYIDPSIHTESSQANGCPNKYFDTKAVLKGGRGPKKCYKKITQNVSKRKPKQTKNNHNFSNLMINFL